MDRSPAAETFFSGKPKCRHLCLITACVLSLLGLALHVVFFSSAGPFFRDEAHEIAIASKASISVIIGRLWLDSSPALYKFFIRGLAFFGDSDLFWRWSGLLIAIVFVGAVIGLFAKPSRRSFPAFSLALPVLSPVVVVQFDSIRPYGLGILFTIVFLALFLRFFRSLAKKTYIASAIAGMLAVNTSYHACFFILAACLSGSLVAVFVFRDKFRVLFILLLGFLVLLASLPYVFVVHKSAYWIITQQMSFPFSIVLTVLRQSAGDTVLVLAVVMIVISVFFLITRALRRGAGSSGVIDDQAEILVVLTTMLLFTIFSLGSFYASGILPTTLRYVPVLVMGAICLDVASFSLPLWWKASVALTLTIIATLQFDDSIKQVAVRQSNTDLVAQAIMRDATADDLVILQSWSSAISFVSYYHGRAPIWTIPNVQDHSFHRYDILRRKFEQREPIADVLSALEYTLRGGHRVFMVGNFRKVSTVNDIAPLAPAPHPKHAWYKVPYLWNMEDRVTQFIIRHVTWIAPATPKIAATINPRENLPLRIAWGWKAQSQRDRKEQE
jgi:hypothetical protein